MIDILIIGNGPAGVSAALYVARAGVKATVIGKDYGSLSRAGEIENYYGFKDPITGQDLVTTGIEQAKRLGVEVLTEEVVNISYENSYVVLTNKNSYDAKCVIIATGSQRNAPKITGIDTFEGKGVSYCAVCDAFFYRKKDVAVLGASDYALHEASEILPIANSVVLLTNGETPDDGLPQGVTVNTKKIKAFNGSDKLEAVEFDDGSSLTIAGVFVAYGVAGSTDLARKLGAQTEGNKITVNENMATNMPGLFAAGDCTGGLLQVSKAVYEGAKAGTQAVKFIRGN